VSKVQFSGLKLGWQDWPDEMPDVPFIEHGWLVNNVKTKLSEFLGKDTRIIVEVGCWLGMSTRFMLDCAPKAKLIAIDHWLGAEGHQEEFKEYLPNLYEKFLRACWDYRSRISVLRDASVVGLVRAEKMLGTQPDLVYIDAGHDYASIFCDTLYAVTLFPKSRIVGDDFSHGCGLDKAIRKVGDMTGKKVCVNPPVWWYE